MKKQKNFLILAIALGIAGVVIGAATIFFSVNEILQP
jgi:hypothetical protein